MPTAAERQALAFLAGVALLGGSVQVWRNRSTRIDAAEMTAVSGAETVDAQLNAVDSARSARAGKRTVKKSSAGGSSGRGARASSRRNEVQAPLMIDVDVATASELEMLPRVGPALAQRIIANRDSLGAFGSLEEFGRVRGIGPAMLKLLEPVTMFSGRGRDRTVRRDQRD